MTAVTSAVLFRSESKGNGFHSNERPKTDPRIQCGLKPFRKHSQMLADFLRFSGNLPFLLQRKVDSR